MKHTIPRIKRDNFGSEAASRQSRRPSAVRRVATASLSAALALVGLAAIGASDAQAAYSARVLATLNARTGPGTNYAKTGSLVYNQTTVTLVCYSSGTNIHGDPYWDRMSDGRYIADYYVDLGNRNPNQVGLPTCASYDAPSAPSVKTYRMLDNLNTRSGPGTNYAVTGSIAKNAYSAISCYATGTNVKGDPYWDKLSDNRWVADYYVDLGDKNPDQVGIPQCSSVPAPPSNGSGAVTAAQQKIVDVAKNSAAYGISAPAGWCAKWVADVYGKAGQPYPYGNAIDFWTKWKGSGSSSRANIPVGAAIITSGKSPQYGHIGIYLGNNQVISNVGGTRIESLDSFVGWATARSTTTGTSGFIGWVWPNGKKLN